MGSSSSTTPKPPLTTKDSSTSPQKEHIEKSEPPEEIKEPTLEIPHKQEETLP
jgi:hypothetical protein